MRTHSPLVNWNTATTNVTRVTPKGTQALTPINVQNVTNDTDHKYHDNLKKRQSQKVITIHTITHVHYLPDFAIPGLSFHTGGITVFIGHPSTGPTLYRNDISIKLK